MSTALLFATELTPDGVPRALLRLGDATTVVERLRRQFAALGDVDEVWVIARPAGVAALRAAGFGGAGFDGAGFDGVGFDGAGFDGVGFDLVASEDVAGDLRLVAAAAGGIAAAGAAPGTSAAGGAAVVLAAADLVAHDGALLPVVSPGVTGTVALLGPPGGGHQPPVRAQRGRVVSVGSAWHQVTAPNAGFLGLLKVGAADAGGLSAACERLRRYGHRDGGADLGGADLGGADLGGADLGGADLDELAGPGGVIGLLLLALVRGGSRVVAHRLRRLACVRVGGPAEAAAAYRALGALDEPRVCLRLAVKEHDDLFATYCVSSYSPRIVRVAARLGLTPNAVTWISIAFAALAAGAFAVGVRPALVLGGALLYLGFVFDCVDGQLARYTHRYSPYGGWLDMVADRAKEYLVYAGLAIGGARIGLGDLWPYALGAMIVQTVRHMTDTWYGALQESAVAGLQQVPLEDRHDQLAGGHGRRDSWTSRLGRALGQASTRMQARPGSAEYWFKRTVVFPIGERWVVIIVTTALFDARITFICLLAWGLLALGYTLLARALRTWSMRIPAMGDHDIPTHRDDGLLALGLGTLGRRWLGPQARRVAPLPLTLAIALLTAVVLVPELFGLDRGHLDPTDDALVALALGVVLCGALVSRHPHDGPLDWLVPATLRAVEYAFLFIVGLHDQVPRPVVFAALSVITMYHYDLAGRLDKRSSPLWLRPLALGWDGRAAVLTAVTLAGVAEAGFVVLTGYLAAVFVIGSLLGVFVRKRPGGRVPAPPSAATGKVPAPPSAATGTVPAPPVAPAPPAVPTQRAPGSAAVPQVKGPAR